MELVSPTMFCRDCGYILDGLPEHRCPECGGPFDPRSPTTFRSTARTYTHRRRWRMLLHPVAILLAAWLCMAAGPSTLLVPVLLAGGIAASIAYRRWWGVVILVVLSPFVPYFLAGAADYSQGKAALWDTGLLQQWQLIGRIDPVYRCPRRSSGCRVNGGEWLTHGAYNTGVRTMISLFGPMSGAYLGPIPTVQQAQSAISGGTEVALADLWSDRLPIGAASVQLSPGAGRNLFNTSGWLIPGPNSEQAQDFRLYFGPISAAVFAEQCVILRQPMTSSDNGALLFLIDRKTGRPFHADRVR